MKPAGDWKDYNGLNDLQCVLRCVLLRFRTRPNQKANICNEVREGTLIKSFKLWYAALVKSLATIYIQELNP